MHSSDDLRGKTLTSKFVLIDGVLKANCALEIDGSGAINTVTSAGSENTDLAGGDVVNFGNKALLPGFVSAHSHAFHRGLRGRSEISARGQDSFWTWRRNMYDYVERLDYDALYEVSTRTYKEMRRSGITCVGEFHYLHHKYQDTYDYELDRAVIDAAKDAGIRLCLLQTYYERAGLDERTASDLAPAQKRYVSPDPSSFWSQFDALSAYSGAHGDGLVTTGVAAHSIRAVAADTLAALRSEAVGRGVPFHMHVEEQPAEVADSLAHMGATPSDFVLDRLKPDESFTAVHCTYTNGENMRRLAECGANICVCPLTEGDVNVYIPFILTTMTLVSSDYRENANIPGHLGDGIPNLSSATDQAHVCLGTDCNYRLCMLEEMRWLAYCQQMKHNRRGLAPLAQSTQQKSADNLFTAATANGARALNLGGAVGSLEPGKICDFVLVDLDNEVFDLGAGESATLMDSLVFGCSSQGVVVGNCVGGKLLMY